MKTIPQRVLRNDASAVLRQAESGERFVITVHGRPVAVLGPYERRHWLRAEEVGDLLSTPTDPGVLDDLRAAGPEHLTDPWQR